MARLVRCVCGSIAAALLALPGSALSAPVPLDLAGSSGSAAGQLSSPFGLAIDGSNNLYVAEFGNDRISVFGPDGAFIRAFGGDVAPPNGGAAFEVCTAQGGCLPGDSGTGPGQFDAPIDVAFDDSGKLYVLEFSNRRVSVIDPAAPDFIRAVGFDVDPAGIAGVEACTEGTGCQTSPLGAGPGQLESPFALAIDSGENIYVGDRDNDRISVFNANAPSFVHAFGYDVAEPDGGTGFEVCPDDGACRVGDGGGLAGQLDNPTGVFVDASGELFVVDSQNHRVSVFDATAPSFEGAFGWDVADPNGDSAFEICPTGGACRSGDFGGGAGQLTTPTGIVLDGAGRLHVVEQGGHRVSVFSAVGPSFVHAFGADVAAPNEAGGFEVCPLDGACIEGESGTGPGELSSPNGIVLDCRGATWVADTANNRLQRFGEPGTQSPPCGLTPSNPAACAAAEATVTGTAGSDVLVGTPARDVVAALGGADVVRGLAGNDLACGGPGGDRLIGGRGRDRLLGQGGRDTLRGGPGRDRLKGGPGRDVLRGGPGRDRQTQ